MHKPIIFAIAVVPVLLGCVMASKTAMAGRPTFDNQNTTYVSQFPAQRIAGSVVVTPFFSPDHSLETQVQLIQSAKVSVDIQIPSFSSFIGCTYSPSGCYGCDAVDLRRNETFTVFQALANAVHAGIKVRILTNKFPEYDCAGKVSPLSFLFLAGADVRFFRTSTFSHTKYMTIDGKTAVVSSINYSKASFLANREAGIIVSDDKSGKIAQYLSKVFQYDFSIGIAHPSRESYPAAQRAVCEDKAPINIYFPKGKPFECIVESPQPNPIRTDADISVIIGPDFAYDTIMKILDNVKKSLYVSIYEISHPDICDKMLQLHRKGIDLKIFLSHNIYGTDEYYSARACYHKLFDAGVKDALYLGKANCTTYSHQKYWIVDQQDVYMSSGNFANSDWPTPPYTYPAYNEDPQRWKNTNRDMTLGVHGDKAVLERFMTVFNTDMKQAGLYDPVNNEVVNK